MAGKNKVILPLFRYFVIFFLFEPYFQNTVLKQTVAPFSYLCRYCDKPLLRSGYPFPHRVAFSFVFLSTFTFTCNFQYSWIKKLKRNGILFHTMQVSQNDYLIFIIPVINTEFPPDYREYPSGEPSGCIWPPGDRDRAYYR